MSYLWESMSHLKLVTNMRAKNDPWFAEYLLHVGSGTEDTNTDGDIRLPDEVCVPYSGSDNDLDNLIDFVFPNLNKNMSDSTYITSRAILSTRNEWVDMINVKMIDRFQGEHMVYHSFDSAMDDPHNYYPPEFLNTLTPNGLPPHVLKLKIGCPVILLRNIDPANGLCNGTRLVVRDFQRNSIDAEIVLGQHAGKHIFLPCIPLCPSDEEMFPFQFKRKQFPVGVFMLHFLSLVYCFQMLRSPVLDMTQARIGTLVVFELKNAKETCKLSCILTSQSELEQETVKWCRQILRNSPMAIRVLKSALNAAEDGHAGLQELGGNATHIFYGTEEAKEWKNAVRDAVTMNLLIWLVTSRALMESKLLSGTTLIVDRYSYSGVAFSAAKVLDIEWCKAPENGLIAPNLVIYLDVQPKKVAERGGYGGERYEKIEFQKKVAEHYHSLRDSTWKLYKGLVGQLMDIVVNAVRLISVVVFL
ncbi:hypothetical protein ZEAMMB73_Zm00001d020290 [Zea mays]|uniref:Uncharacterized protein n=2 Tax=Zea mays TaxID=4577 RepID=A0A1D6I3C2_MAIZE|nr:hypothetical protein ZEAMMB73_Zm00001d020290 [Zea mays]